MVFVAVTGFFPEADTGQLEHLGAHEPTPLPAGWIDPLGPEGPGVLDEFVGTLGGTETHLARPDRPFLEKTKRESRL